MTYKRACEPTYHSQELLLPKCSHVCFSPATCGSACQVVQKCPPLLACCVDRNLAPTFQFYKEVAPAEALQSLLSTPSILSSSLDKNIKPRYWCDCMSLVRHAARTYPDEYTHTCVPNHEEALLSYCG